MLPSFDRTKLRLSNGALMPIVTIGHGRTPVVYIPGAGDGLSTAYDAAWNMAWFFRSRTPRQRLHIISRREDIPGRYDIADHARDYSETLDRLRFGPVVLECNSAGGPIGQLIAAHRPDLVRALVLASTAPRIDARAHEVFTSWLTMVDSGQWAELTWDTTVRTYRSALRAQWAGPLLKPILGALSRPKNPERFKRLLEGLLSVDNSSVLEDISCPTLVFGGTRDPIFASGLQQQMAAAISHARYVGAPGLLHGADLESPAYPAAMNELIAAS
ncbi:alpha/beta fold hydrolase [Brevibacterium marinum]|uniref:3-oxoadipate enol-lactonase n=1 Tax=Brevibacterium marinum TaxID=418643 RepID=A0A846S4M9_9MICO|nr:alpha/beta hydrolase [Brevibacterium marinum]NJC58725.1 3-oxoadipate enol-lactonase [Brevibacterium marinum]